ncbi:MAG TPA: universal stress protein [Rhizomicrobium sp.]|nr:universal stress protein [Rhizomicrobium sp.]
MTYKSLLVHMDLNGDNEGLLKIAGDLAERFDAKVIGIAAAQPIQPLYDQGVYTADLATQHRNEVDKEIAACRAQFRQVLATRVRQLEWRSTVTFESLASYIASEARCADLIITGKDIGASLLDDSRRVNIGDLAVKAGRPVLIVPQGISALPLEHVFVAWKDSREARRAAVDALPLLNAAGHATVMEVTPEDGKASAEKRVKDVVRWLESHGIDATPRAIGARGMEAGCLHAELLNRKCDLLVAGAYGHNRLGEWLFGGVTTDVLLDPDFCVLLAH